MLWITLTLSSVAFFIVCYWIGNKLTASVHVKLELPSDMPLEQVTIPSASGNKLAAWFIAGETGKGSVVLMHGIRANRSVLIKRAQLLNRAGYTILLFDFQAHGESEGDTITFGQLESLDAQSAVDFMKQREPKQKLAVIGVSLGGAAALLGLNPESIDALIIESVYADIATAIQNRMEIRFGRLGRLLAPIFMLQIRYRLGFDPALLNPVEKIKNFSCPLLVIAGAMDRRTTPKDSMRLFRAAPQGEKQFWLIPDAQHVDFHLHQGDIYELRLLNFLKQHLSIQKKTNTKLDTHTTNQPTPSIAASKFNQV